MSRWLPVLAWAGVISLFSTGAFSGSETSRILVPLLHALFPGLGAEDLATIHAWVRKLAHPAEYAVLAVLVRRALDRPERGAIALVVLTLALCAAYAALDELHQHFVPERVGAPDDVALDTVGAAVGLVARALYGKLSADRRWRA